MTCHVWTLYILHCCKYSVKQFKGTFASTECVFDSHAKYPAGICLLHLGKCIKFVGTIVLSPRMKDKDCCKCLLVCPRGRNLTQDGDPRVGKLTFENLKMSNFPWFVPPPPAILGQTIDRCINFMVPKGAMVNGIYMITA